MDYDAIKAIRATHLKVLAKSSPLHYRHAVEHEGSDDSDTASRVFLRAIHCAVLEPGKFIESYGVYQDSATRRGRSWDLWQAANPAKIGLLPSQMDQIIAIVHALDQHEGARKLLPMSVGGKLLDIGRSEAVVEWTEARTGLRCKAQIDRLLTDPREIWDLKTTGSVHPDFVHGQIRKLGWDLQLAHYRAGVQAVYGPVTRCGLILVEQAAPHDVACYEIPVDMLDAAEERRQNLLQIIADCTRVGHWPGHASAIIELPPASWQEAEITCEDEEESNES